MKVIQEIRHGEFFMHMFDRVALKKTEDSLLISFTFIRKRLIPLVFIQVFKVSIAIQSI